MITGIPHPPNPARVLLRDFSYWSCIGSGRGRRCGLGIPLYNRNTVEMDAGAFLRAGEVAVRKD